MMCYFVAVLPSVRAEGSEAEFIWVKRSVHRRDVRNVIQSLHSVS